VLFHRFIPPSFLTTPHNTFVRSLSPTLPLFSTTQEPVTFNSSPIGGGGFTSSNAESRRTVPEDPGTRPVFKVVYVVLESQYQSSMTAAVKRINAGNPNMAVECVGYLLEELRNDDTLKSFKADLADANIFIGSLIFIQELAEKVQAVVEPERERLDAVLIFPSMPEVMRLNKVGKFTMKNLGQSQSVIGDFMKKKKKEDGSSFEEVSDEGP